MSAELVAPGVQDATQSLLGFTQRSLSSPPLLLQSASVPHVIAHFFGPPQPGEMHDCWLSQSLSDSQSSPRVLHATNATIVNKAAQKSAANISNSYTNCTASAVVESLSLHSRSQIRVCHTEI